MLHLVFQSPLESAILERIGAGDAVLFLENATLRLLKNSAYSTQIQQLSATNRLFALQADTESRGINISELINSINLIDYDAFVSLTTEHKTIQSWF